MISERQLDHWWETFAKPSLIEFLKEAQQQNPQPKPPSPYCKPPPPELVEKWMRLDYKGDEVAQYGVDFAGRDQLLHFKTAEPIDTDGKAWTWFKDKVKALGYDVVYDNESTATIRMTKGDKYGDILKAAAWTYSKLREDG